MNDQHPKLVIDSQLARGQLAQEFTSRVDLDRKRRNSIERPCNRKRDMSGFSFVLILMLLCEIAASQTDNPVFWLLVGPTPLALALASSRLFRNSRYRSRRGFRGHFWGQPVIYDFRERGNKGQVKFHGTEVRSLQAESNAAQARCLRYLWALCEQDGKSN